MQEDPTNASAAAAAGHSVLHVPQTGAHARRPSKGHVNFAAELGTPVTVVTEEGDDSDSEDIVEDVKALKARQQREKYRHAIQKRHRELFAIQERLYSVRWDTHRPPGDIQNEVRNLTKEVVRLRKMIQALYDREIALLETQIKLDELDLDPSLSSPSWAPNLEKSSLTASQASAIATTEAEFDQELDALEKQMFMRTKSTMTLSGKPPAEKWAGLLRMFGEYRRQTSIAQAQDAASVPVQDNTLEDVASIRAALHALRQKKELSPKDKALQAKLQRRLQDLTK